MEDIIVIGGGLMGSSAAWQLSQAGAKVLLLEQQSSLYKTGSSYGNSRITRDLGPKNDIFAYLQRTTMEEIKQLLRFLNGITASKAHKMSDIFTKSPVTYIYNQSQESKVKALGYKGQKTKFKKAKGDEAFRKFGLSVSDSQIVVRETGDYAGTINPNVLIKKLKLGIEKHGNRIRYDQKTVKLSRKNGYYEIKTVDTKTDASHIYQAKKVVLAAGLHNMALLNGIAPYFKKLIHAKRVLLSYFKINKKKYESFTLEQQKLLEKSQPVFSQTGKMLFSMIDGRDKKGQPVFKVGGHILRRNIQNTASVWKEKPLKKDLKWNKRKFLAYIKMLELPIRKKDIELVKAHYCVYSVSNTEIPYVTPLFTKKEDVVDTEIVVIGGMSGVGAKACLAYGLLAADYMMQTSRQDSMYKRVQKKLGIDRLRKELREMDKKNLL